MIHYIYYEHLSTLFLLYIVQFTLLLSKLSLLSIHILLSINILLSL